MPATTVDTLVRGGQVVTSSETYEASIAIRGEKIVAIGPDELPQANRPRVARRNHDLHPVLEDLEDVEGLLVTGDLTRLDTDNLRHTVSRIDDLFSDLELSG